MIEKVKKNLRPHKHHRKTLFKGIEAFGYPTYFLFLDSSTESETNMKDMVLCARKRKTGNSSYIIATSLENLNSEIFVGKLKSNNLIGTR